MQLWTMLVLPPTNHLKNGLLLSSRTVVHFSNHSSSSARCAQNPCRSLRAKSAIASQSGTWAFVTMLMSG